MDEQLTPINAYFIFCYKKLLPWLKRCDHTAYMESNRTSAKASQDAVKRPGERCRRIFVAEKPSLGRAIAAALAQPQSRHDGYIETANGDVVTWCFGHLLQLVDADAYDPKLKRWSLADLPIVPAQWRVEPRARAAKQLAVIRRLIKAGGQVVNAGDPDREGQLLVDEVIDFIGCSQSGVLRLLVSDLNVDAVKTALTVMRSNRDFAALSSSALARSRADWLWGINMTRAYTLLGQKAGYKGVLSVGRVQTPVLGLVVNRDEEIANFVSKPFHEVHALIPHDGSEIEALWIPSEACAPYQDEQGRIVYKPLAENVAKRIKGEPATLVSAEHRETKEAPPLPFSLSSLQIEAAKRFSLSAADVLAAAQSLYETHQAITYPRSDCRHLPADHHKQAVSVCAAIAMNAPELAPLVNAADITVKSKAWDDKKVTAHHAIIPTTKQQASSFSATERKIYDLIARQYLMQFCAAAVHAKAELIFSIGTGTFIARARVLRSPGWKALALPAKKSKGDKKPAYVPVLAAGTTLTCRRGRVSNKKTEAPKPFSDATILQAMTGIARFVKDEELRKVLRDTDGLGTEATRASILETLFKRRLLQRKAKKITATPLGAALIRALPQVATAPDMTAQWERTLRQVAEGKAQMQPFLDALKTKLAETLVAPARGEVPASMHNVKAVSDSTPQKTKKATRPKRRATSTNPKP